MTRPSLEEIERIRDRVRDGYDDSDRLLADVELLLMEVDAP